MLVAVVIVEDVVLDMLDVAVCTLDVVSVAMLSSAVLYALTGSFTTGKDEDVVTGGINVCGIRIGDGAVCIVNGALKKLVL